MIVASDSRSRGRLAGSTPGCSTLFWWSCSHIHTWLCHQAV